MQYLFRRHGLLRQQRSMTRRGAVACAITAVAATMTACTGSSSSPSPPASASAAASVRISGAGSTFDAPFFGLAFAAYQRSHPGVAVSYDAVGSSAGITRFTAGQVGFGATDVPARAADLAGATGGPAIQVPVDLGAVSVAYNVPRRNGEPLKLTGPVLAEIFLGQITQWNDPAIAGLNPGADLPATSISVVHRADGSGTTYIFSDYLSTVSSAWASKVGTGRSLHWPVGFAADGNPGVAEAIQRIPFSIGYVERSFTTGTSLGSAAIQNRAGQFVTPSSAAIAADAAAKPAVTASDFSIVNQAGNGAYPISGYSWVLISARQQDQGTGRALVALIGWLTHDGQPYAAKLGYVTMPAAIQQLAATSLARVAGPDGQPLTG